MKKFKKFFAVLLSLAMVMAMSMTAFAAGGTPNAKDTEKATVSNVEKDATVTAYQIVEADYNQYGFVGYKNAAKISEKMLADPLKPTSTEVAAIADKIATKEITGLKSTVLDEGSAVTIEEGERAEYTAQLEAGYWVVIVTGSKIQEVYNPMLVGVWYSVSGSDNTMTNQPVDANANWTLETENAWAKSAQPTIDKKITGQSGKETSDGNESGDDVAVGDIVNFEIDTNIPSYSDSYSTVVVDITDRMDKGLELADEVNLKVMVGGAEVKAGDDTYTYTPDEDNKGFVISFNSEYALSNPGATVIVTYNAKLVEGYGYNFDANNNEAKLTYTHDPDGNTNEIKDNTYTYTFGIDAEINGEGSWLTSELLKTGEEIVTDNGTEKRKGLKGAKFTLTNDDTGKVYEATSGESGEISFKGLDAGKYTLVETEAPSGYSINKAEIPVVISATYKADGQLETYSISVGGKVVDDGSTRETTYTMNDNKSLTTTVTTTDKDGNQTTNEYPNKFVDDNYQSNNEGHDNSNTYEIVNTTLNSLPSTGGIGTTIFTIGGCIIMVAAAALFFASRRKSAK